MISGNIHGTDERGRIIRRTLARYLLMLQALTFQAVSTSARRRFPTEDHLVEAGLMSQEERLAYDEVPSTHGKWWTPATWFTTLAIRARKEGRIKDDILLRQILDELYIYRNNCGMLFSYDWISIPLVYTQTVTIATYTYFVANVMGRQYLDPLKGYSGHDIDLYVPIFTILEFFFFMGWLKVAEQLINPFGEDDDDFELNWILDRNLVVSMYIVDQMHNRCPKLVKDLFWDDIQPTLPYTRSSYGLRSQPHLGSAMNLDINIEDTEFMSPLETIMENDVENNQYLSHSLTPTQENLKVDDDQNLKAEHPSLLNSSLFSEIQGGRLNNLTIGRSFENVSHSGPKNLTTSGTNIFNPLASTRPPRRRFRKGSTASSLKPSMSSRQISKESMLETPPRSSVVGRRASAPFENDNMNQSMVLDLQTNEDQELKTDSNLAVKAQTQENKEELKGSQNIVDSSIQDDSQKTTSKYLSS